MYYDWPVRNGAVDFGSSPSLIGSAGLGRGQRRRTGCEGHIALKRIHPCVDEAVVIDPHSPLPSPNDTFDLIVSDSTCEHVSDATRLACSRLVDGSVLGRPTVMAMSR